jgi:hypothetical protein
MGMKMVAAFLDVLSKGAFIIYVNRIRRHNETLEKPEVSQRCTQGERTQSDGFFDLDGVLRPWRIDQDGLDDSTHILITMVLTDMGRSKDEYKIVDLLESCRITSTPDILALRREHCSEIGLPWGLVLALKSKIRSQSLQVDDPWLMQTSGKTARASTSAPRFAKSASSEMLMMGENMSENDSDCGYSCSARSGHPSPRSPAPPTPVPLTLLESGSSDEGSPCRDRFSQTTSCVVYGKQQHVSSFTDCVSEPESSILEVRLFEEDMISAYPRSASQSPVRNLQAYPCGPPTPLPLNQRGGGWGETECSSDERSRQSSFVEGKQRREELRTATEPPSIADIPIMSSSEERGMGAAPPITGQRFVSFSSSDHVAESRTQNSICDGAKRPRVHMESHHEPVPGQFDARRQFASGSADELMVRTSKGVQNRQAAPAA